MHVCVVCLTGSSLPRSRLRSVDFPTPLGPTMATGGEEGEEGGGRGGRRKEGELGCVVSEEVF